MPIDRRELLQASAAAAIVVAASDVIAAPGAGTKPARPAKPVPPAPIAAGAHRVVELPFDPTKLKGLSEKLVVSHHDNNYAGAVKNLNKVELDLAKVDKDTPGYLVAALRERELTYTNSMILHEQYFGNLGGDGKVAGAIGKRLDAAFGSAARWEELFRATAMGLGGGSGWVVVALNFQSKDLRIYGTTGHNQAVAAGTPLLVIDMFEHSYHLDYGAAHASYIDAFLQNVDWAVVDSRLARADKAAAALA
jgi:superoxide dismutase, Fe-Mn family